MFQGVILALAFSAPVDRHQTAADAQTVMVRCFFAQAPALDDHVSDAATIARAVVDACYPLVEVCKHAYFEESRPRYSAIEFYKQFDEVVPDLALQTVLKVRASAKR